MLYWTAFKTFDIPLTQRSTNIFQQVNSFFKNQQYDQVKNVNKMTRVKTHFPKERETIFRQCPSGVSSDPGPHYLLYNETVPSDSSFGSSLSSPRSWQIITPPSLSSQRGRKTPRGQRTIFYRKNCKIIRTFNTVSSYKDDNWLLGKKYPNTGGGRGCAKN